VSERSLDDILLEAVDLHNTISVPEEYQAIWSLLGEARVFGREALEAGLALLSGDVAERCIGCDLLGVLCNPDEEGWGHEVATAVVALAESEENDDVYWSMADALHFAADPIGIPILGRLANHPDPDVRFKVASGLPSCQDPEITGQTEVTRVLMKLMEDESDVVRDWATFGLGQQLNSDTPEIRDALFSRLNDTHDDTRYEALIGLARRRDSRALPAVIEALRQDTVFRLAIEAATYLGDERLFPLLEPLRSWWDVDSALLESAMNLCNPEVQRKQLQEMDRFLSDFEKATDGVVDKPSVRLFCDLFGTHVDMEISTTEGTGLRFGFDELMERGSGDSVSAVSAVLSDLRNSENP